MDKFIEKILENQAIQESQYVSEGFLHDLNKLFLWMGFGKPAHPLFKVARKSFEKCQELCGVAYKDVTSQSVKSQSNDPKKELVEVVKQNPERGKCLIVCYFDLMRSMRDVIKANKNTICSKNINEDLCEQWIEKNLPEFEANIKAMENAVRMMQGVRTGEVHKIKKVVDILNKVL